MLIESLAQKTKLALMTVLATIGGCTLICGFTVWCCISLVTKEREQIYILDSHPVVNHSAQRIDPLAHVRLSGAQKIVHGIIQTEHGRIICVSIQMSVQGFQDCQNGF